VNSLLEQFKAAKAAAEAAAYKKAPEPAATRVPEPPPTVTPPPTASSGSDAVPTEKKITGPRREVVWVKYPPVGFDIGTEWELVPIAKKSQARLNHAAGYSMVDLVRPLKANVTMKVMAIVVEADRSIQVEVIL
jgi:hypothetical protein